YEPEQFPGLVYRMDDPHVVFLLFSSGNVVCVGAKKVDDVKKGINKLVRQLRKIPKTGH
ncbi:MAG: TATA-box-binding protein, partial [Candidatus Aenigmarchaeota archaeon ex4484_14]